MQKFANHILLTSMLVCALGGRAQQNASQPGTSIRGWLSDERCARGRAESGTYTGTNPRCAKECVAKGRKIVLIDPDRKRILEIANPSLAKKNVGDYVEIVGRMDEKAAAIRIASLKMLAPGAAACERPKLNQ
jgi:hypothetical protein